MSDIPKLYSQSFRVGLPADFLHGLRDPETLEITERKISKDSFVLSQLIAAE